MQRTDGLFAGSRMSPDGWRRNRLKRRRIGALDLMWQLQSTVQVFPDARSAEKWQWCSRSDVTNVLCSLLLFSCRCLSASAPRPSDDLVQDDLSPLPLIYFHWPSRRLFCHCRQISFAYRPESNFGMASGEKGPER